VTIAKRPIVLLRADTRDDRDGTATQGTACAPQPSSAPRDDGHASYGRVMSAETSVPTLEEAQRLLAERFGLAGFRPGQVEVIEALLAGRSALAVFPTGSGKSLCYQLPALMLDGVTVVVSPLIALMKDQIDALEALGVPAARIDSSLSLDELRDVSDRLRRGDLRLLYVAPERFNNERFVAQLAGVEIALFAVDEAHCISEWGHNFRPDYLKLAQRARELGAARVLALTATATPAVVDDICAGFGIARGDAVSTGAYRPNLTLLTTTVCAAERDDLLVERIRSRPAGSTIVYVTLQRTALRIADLLARSGLPARPYHAGMKDEDRAATQDWWAGSADGIVVATVAFGMGIDKADVRYVYHYNLPKGLESYAQEIGRAGRDGVESVCELLACPDDVPVLENFAYGDTPSREALVQLLGELLAGTTGEELVVAEHDVSTRFDVRPLVLKTLLTYLELEGLLRQGTPFYAGYRMRPLRESDWDAVFAGFDHARRGFLERIVAAAKQGRVWMTLAPDEVAQALGEDRSRVVSALGYLEDQGLVELQPAEPRQRYSTIATRDDRPALVDELLARCERRERAEIERIQRVLALVTADQCQVRTLVAYFGEHRPEPCGHCSHCLSGRAVLPPASPLPAPGSIVLPARLAALRAEQAFALGQPRQLARFLCGLSSPATTRTKLTRHELYGALAAHRFADVLALCAGPSRA
jgi:ATP-dependent DNA helicase RecQ